MGVLAHDCTDVRLQRVRNQPPDADKELASRKDNSSRALLQHRRLHTPGWPLAGNADAIHLASCRGTVVVQDCVAERQGDDGLNIHSQYAVVQAVLSSTQDVHGSGSYEVSVGQHANADNTSWGCLFARPVFRGAHLPDRLRGAVQATHHMDLHSFIIALLCIA